MFWSFAFIFIFCYFGQSIRGQFNQLNDVIYEFEWYLYPVEIQRMIPTILIATQNTPSLKGFGNVNCTHETFKKVCLIIIIFWSSDIMKILSVQKMFEKNM